MQRREFMQPRGPVELTIGESVEPAARQTRQARQAEEAERAREFAAWQAQEEARIQAQEEEGVVDSYTGINYKYSHRYFPMDEYGYSEVPKPESKCKVIVEFILSCMFLFMLLGTAYHEATRTRH